MKKIALIALLHIVLYPVYPQARTTQPKVLRDANGIVKSVEFQGTSESPPNAVTFFGEYLELTPRDSFKEVPNKSKKNEEKHERYEQYYNGIRVAGAGYTFHFIQGRLTFAQGHFVRIDNIDTSPAISSRDAAVAFARHLGIPVDSVDDHKGQLMIKEIDQEKEGQGGPKLVYQIRLFSDHLANTEFGYIFRCSFRGNSCGRTHIHPYISNRNLCNEIQRQQAGDHGKYRRYIPS